MADEAALLLLLLVYLLVVGLVLVLASGVTLGRKLADLSYQKATGVNGINQIQSWVNARTHANRVQLGLVFVAISILSLVEVPPVVLSWSARGLFAWLLTWYAVTSILDWRDDDKIMRMQIDQQTRDRASQDVLATEAVTRREADISADFESYRQIAAEAVANLEAAANLIRHEQGAPPIEVIPDVLPEHSSPVSARQSEQARIATLRARNAAAVRVLGVPPDTGGGGM